jgi:hypothetical protein
MDCFVATAPRNDAVGTDLNFKEPSLHSSSPGLPPSPRLRRASKTKGRHTPRRRGIQYAAASRFQDRRLWNTGSPACAGDDSECAALALPFPNIASLSRGMIYPRFSFCRPSTVEGAGNAGCALHPRSRVQDAQGKAHTSIQVQRRQSGIPCAMVLRLMPCSPRRRIRFVTVVGGLRLIKLG